MTLSAITPKNFAKAIWRHHQHRKPSVDLNADVQGRRAAGDPRLDLIAFERQLRL